jgi:hypothetical protein
VTVYPGIAEVATMIDLKILELKRRKCGEEV